jgi:REP element-mobilizing transposase RayT
VILGRRSYRRRLPHYQSDLRSYLVGWVTRNRRELPAIARDIVLRAIIEKTAETAYVHKCVVMPEHVHMVITPGYNRFGEIPAIAEIVGPIKGASAREVNRALGWSGRLWQREFFDHELRRDESIADKCEYIRQNPVRRGLVDDPDDYPWLWPK